MKLPALSLSLTVLLFTACRQPSQSSHSPAQAIPVNQNPVASCVNLNKASAEELRTLPGIGDVLAQKLVEYRQRHGGFRRPQEIIVIEGFSEKKYRALADLVCVE
jgi:competence protein ComEA